MLIYANRTTIQQLKDCAVKVNQKSDKQAISEMFRTELKFVADSLIRYFEKKIKNQHLELSQSQN